MILHKQLFKFSPGVEFKRYNKTWCCNTYPFREKRIEINSKINNRNWWCIRASGIMNRTICIYDPWDSKYNNGIELL